MWWGRQRCHNYSCFRGYNYGNFLEKGWFLRQKERFNTKARGEQLANLMQVPWVDSECIKDHEIYSGYENYKNETFFALEKFSKLHIFIIFIFFYYQGMAKFIFINVLHLPANFWNLKSLKNSNNFKNFRKFFVIIFWLWKAQESTFGGGDEVAWDRINRHQFSI